MYWGNLACKILVAELHTEVSRNVGDRADYLLETLDVIWIYDVSRNTLNQPKYTSSLCALQGHSMVTAGHSPRTSSRAIVSTESNFDADTIENCPVLCFHRCRCYSNLEPLPGSLERATLNSGWRRAVVALATLTEVSDLKFKRWSS